VSAANDRLSQTVRALHGTFVLLFLMNKITNAPTPLPLDDDLTIPIEERKTVETLQLDSCRWPFGDPVEHNFYFCGKQKSDGSPYCEFHMRRAYRPAQMRRLFFPLRVA
jgi:GcrA cell cycle regulator